MTGPERRLRELLPGAGVGAGFRAPGPPRVDVVLTPPGSLGDEHHRLAWRRFAAGPEPVAEYREPRSAPEDYERRKREFLGPVVGVL